MSIVPLLHASPVIRIHAILAILVMLLGALQLFRKKGDPLHRVIGRVWVVGMAAVAGSGLLIWTIRVWGPFSPIHLLSILVLALLWRGVMAARRGEIERHRKIMRGTYVFGLVITGLFTVVPGRTMYFVVFGADGATPIKLAVFAGVLAVLAAACVTVLRWRASPRGQRFVADR
ncbi:MAG: DUF2306 domain-containing protein [Candidatus Kaistia colombiensis]|nr:MAG: DUF2306 domain-containing protein [Kaistia sp.]